MKSFKQHLNEKITDEFHDNSTDNEGNLYHYHTINNDKEDSMEIRHIHNPKTSHSQTDFMINGDETHGDMRGHPIEFLRKAQLSINDHIIEHRPTNYSFSVRGDKKSRVWGHMAKNLVNTFGGDYKVTKLSSGADLHQIKFNYNKMYVNETYKEFLDKPTPSLDKIAKKKKIPLEKLKKELKTGINHEKEHTSRTDVAKEIALDHIGEIPDYYKRLKKIEEAERTPERAKKLLDYLHTRPKYRRPDREGLGINGYNSYDDYLRKQSEHDKKHVKQIKPLAIDAYEEGWPKGFGNIKPSATPEDIPINKIKTDQHSISIAAVKDKIDHPDDQDYPEYYYHKPSGYYYLADGNHRTSAARILRKKTIKGIVHR